MFGRYGKKFMALLVVVAIAVVGWQTSVTSQPPAPAFPIAQTTTETLCREVIAPLGVGVRTQPNADAQRIATINVNQRVTLAPDYRGITDTEGRIWLEIVSPFNGFIPNGFPGGTSNLGLCEARRPETLCRQIDLRAAPNGTEIRANASRFSPVRSTVPAGGQVTLTPGYRLVPDINGEQRDWVLVTDPMRGFVSADTLILCQGEPATAAPQTTSPQTTSPQTTTPQTTDANLCRQVDRRAAPNGLAIRVRPSRQSEQVGGVSSGGRLTLVSDFKGVPDADGESRTWVEITAPTRGFVTTTSLIMCQG